MPVVKAKKDEKQRDKKKPDPEPAVTRSQEKASKLDKSKGIKKNKK